MTILPALVPLGITFTDGQAVTNTPVRPGRHRRKSLPARIATSLTEPFEWADKMDSVVVDFLSVALRKLPVAGKNLVQKMGKFLKSAPARMSHSLHDALSAKREERSRALECECDFSPAAFQKKVNDSMELVRAAQVALKNARTIARTPRVSPQARTTVYATAA